MKLKDARGVGYKKLKIYAKNYNKFWLGIS